MKSRTRSLRQSGHDAAVKLTLDRAFRACPAEPGDEVYRNGVFEFNITRLSSFVEASAKGFVIEQVEIDAIPNYGGEHLDEDVIARADLSRPILLAEISPGRFNVIDGNHRVARARREGARTLPARRVACPHHVRFLTSTRAYEIFVEYWNGKMALSC